MHINYTAMELFEKCNCLRSWGKIHCNSRRRVYSHTWFQITTFSWHCQFCFKLSCQWIQAKRVVLHNRACHIGKAKELSCHPSVKFTHQKMSSLQHYKDESSKWHFMTVLFLSCSPKAILLQISLILGQQRLAETQQSHQLPVSVLLRYCRVWLLPLIYCPFFKCTLLPAAPYSLNSTETNFCVKPWS